MNSNHHIGLAIDGYRSAPCPSRMNSRKDLYSAVHRQRSGNRYRNGVIFSLTIWIVEIALLLLQNKCIGFVPIEYTSLVPLSYSSPPQKWQPRWMHGRCVLSVASSLTYSSDTTNNSISSILITTSNKNIEETSVVRCSTRSSSFSLELAAPEKSRRRGPWNFLKARFLFWKSRNDPNTAAEKEPPTSILEFTYDYDVIDLPVGNSATSSAGTTGIILIHPIGVGIARWFYQRLVSSLIARQEQIGERWVVVVPDLLGSGSACNATLSTSGKLEPEVATKYPLFNISDWADQVEALMSSIEGDTRYGKIDKWCVIANGGCSPIALQLARRKIVTETKKGHSAVPVSNLILSSVPRLPFFLKNQTTNDPTKVAKSYKTLSGIPGKLFWWYACRNKGAFIQTFSEKNLIADPQNLGPNWRSNCYQTAVSFGGRGKYATFSFLAGTLQDGCLPSLDAIKDSPLSIDIIKGADVRRNRAKSWFWQKPKIEKKNSHELKEGRLSDSINATSVMNTDAVVDASTIDVSESKAHETFRDYAEKNGNGGRELVVGGRISLAHEDSDGYADAILQFLWHNSRQANKK